jgi:hypothetical protein
MRSGEDCEKAVEPKITISKLIISALQKRDPRMDEPPESD